MSQSSKRPGAKDISELKARLGLKKNGPAASGAASSSGGIVAPPGTRAAGGAIPAPPGASPPRPVIPDAKEDPFGAMNALAAHGSVSAQPQIVVVNDGSPVERVEKRSSAVRFALIGGLVLVPLVLGVTVGKLSAKAAAYNVTVDDAALVRDDTNKMREGLVALQTTLQSGRERSRGAQFLVGDSKLTAELAALPPLSPNIELVFRSHLYELDPQLVAAILSFYVEAIELNDLIKTHVTASKDAERVLKEGQTNMAGFDPRAYAGVIDVPTSEEAQQGKPIALRLVQLGAPVCEGQTKPSETGCGATKVTGFRYRFDELGPWGVKKLATGGSGDFDTEGLVRLDPGSKVLQQLAKGGKSTVAEASYTERINKINDAVNKLLESQKAIEGHLTNHANKSKEFTFFM